MPIACLAWGSLLWKPGPLPLASPWRADGPPLPLEFARVGDHGELAVALCDGAADMPTFHARLDVPDLATARARLREREEIDPKRPQWVGSIRAGEAPHGAWSGRIAAWAAAQGLDAVVWTALPPRYDGEDGRAPNADEAVAYLDGLRGEVRAHAEDYVRRVPDAIRTPHRQAIERRLGWTPRAG